VNESQVFANALRLATAPERAAYLDRACAGNPTLREAVAALLRAHAADPDFLERPPAALVGTAEMPAPTGTPADRASGRPMPPRSSPGGCWPAATGCCSRSARAAWAPSSWPSSCSRCSAW
jgi:hypothetical protein